MTGLQERYDQVVRQLAKDYEARGYAVQLQSHVDNVNGPPLDVDLLARRGEETVLVQVKLATTASPSRALSAYAELARRRGWRFVIAVADSKNVEEVEVPTPEAVRRKVREARSIDPASTAAALLAWSVLEGAARLALATSGTRIVRSKTPAALIQELAALGRVSTDEERHLQRFVQARNRLAHGFWDAPHQPSDVHTVLALAERLVDDDLAESK